MINVKLENINNTISKTIRFTVKCVHTGDSKYKVICNVNVNNQNRMFKQAIFYWFLNGNNVQPCLKMSNRFRFKKKTVTIKKLVLVVAIT